MLVCVICKLCEALRKDNRPCLCGARSQYRIGISHQQQKMTELIIDACFRLFRVFATINVYNKYNMING